MAITKHKTGSANPKVYVALLNQVTISTTSGLLEVGKTYIIKTLTAGDDFANVGYVDLSTPFVATGTTPTTWTNLTEVINMTDSAPVALVLENTIGGDIIWTYSGVREYNGTLSNAFPENKTAFFINLGETDFGSDVIFSRNSNNDVFIMTAQSSTNTDGVLSNSTVEIRVYS